MRPFARRLWRFLYRLLLARAAALHGGLFRPEVAAELTRDRAERAGSKAERKSL